MLIRFTKVAAPVSNIETIFYYDWHSWLNSAIKDCKAWEKGLWYSREYWVYKRIFNYLEERYKRNKANYLNMAKIDIDLPNKQVEYWFRECIKNNDVDSFLMIHAYCIYSDELVSGKNT